MASAERRSNISLSGGLRYLYAFICRLAGRESDPSSTRSSGTVRSGSAAAVGSAGAPSEDHDGKPLRLHIAKARGSLAPASAYTVVVSVYSRSIGPTPRMRSAGSQVVRLPSSTDFDEMPSQAGAIVLDCCAQLHSSAAWKKGWSQRLPSCISGSDGSVDWSNTVYPPVHSGSVILVEVIDVTRASSSAGVEGVVGACIVLPAWLSPVSSHASTVTGLFTAPNPGWYLLAKEGAAPAQGRAVEVLMHVGGHDKNEEAARTVAEAALVPMLPAPHPAALLAPDAPRILVQQHHHTVYCDRKRQVCTAEGAVREGNVLVAVCPALGLTDPQASLLHAAPGTRAHWYASSPAQGTAAALAHVPTLSPGHIMQGIADAAPDAYIDGNTQTLMLRVDKVSEEQVWRMPALPGGRSIPKEDEEKLPEDITAQILATLGANAGSHPESPLYSPVAALRLLRSQALSASRNPLSWYCTLPDVGRCLAALVIVQGTGAMLTHAASAVEAAPPRIREAWIDGAAVTGSALVAHCWYYGGAPGLCDLTWIRVDAEGNRNEAQPRAFDPLAHYPVLGSEESKRDPRILYITSADVGCSYKVTIEPVRQDGVRGAPTASKPTADIVES